MSSDYEKAICVGADTIRIGKAIFGERKKNNKIKEKKMLSSILYGLAHLSNIILNMLSLIIIVSIGISWFSADPYNQYVRIVRSLTEPMYRPFRKFTQRLSGPIDFSPMIVMLIIIFLQKSLPRYLMLLSHQLE